MKSNQLTTYTKTETDTLLNNKLNSWELTNINNNINLKANQLTTYTKTEADTLLDNKLNSWEFTNYNNTNGNINLWRININNATENKILKIVGGVLDWA